MKTNSILYMLLALGIVTMFILIHMVNGLKVQQTYIANIKSNIETISEQLQIDIINIE